MSDSNATQISPRNGEPSESPDNMAAALRVCFEALERAVEQWHEAEPEAIEAGGEAGAMSIVPLLLEVHLANFRLWHLEDAARRDDAGFEFVARCKRAIDAMNQKRNDSIEQLDAQLESLIANFLPPHTPHRYNTETMGGGLDRLSILHLKLYHMREQTQRNDVQQEHLQRCQARLELLERQRLDLQRSLLELLSDYVEGRKRPKIYRQFKMYNDPQTNPELYRQTKY